MPPSAVPEAPTSVSLMGSPSGLHAQSPRAPLEARQTRAGKGPVGAPHSRQSGAAAVIRVHRVPIRPGAIAAVLGSPVQCFPCNIYPDPAEARIVVQLAPR